MDAKSRSLSSESLCRDTSSRRHSSLVSQGNHDEAGDSYMKDSEAEKTGSAPDSEAEKPVKGSETKRPRTSLFRSDEYQQRIAAAEAIKAKNLELVEFATPRPRGPIVSLLPRLAIEKKGQFLSHNRQEKGALLYRG